MDVDVGGSVDVGGPMDVDGQSILSMTLMLVPLALTFSVVLMLLSLTLTISQDRRPLSITTPDAVQRVATWDTSSTV